MPRHAPKRSFDITIHHRAGVQLLVTTISHATAQAIIDLVYKAHRVLPPGKLPPIKAARRGYRRST